MEKYGQLRVCRRLPSILAAIHEEAQSPSLRITALAVRMRLSRNHLGRIVKQSTGDSYPQYLRKVRVELACRHLIDHGKSVKEVAASAGFRSTAALDHAFKKVLGISPVAYRRALPARQACASDQWTGE